MDSPKHGRFTTEDGDFYASPDGEMCLYDDYKALVDKLSSESKRADDMMHRGDSWREMCDELEAKLKGQSLRLNKALDALKFIAWQGLPDTKSGYAKGVLMELTGAVERQKP